MSDSSDEETPKLSAETLKALQEFYNEQVQENGLDLNGVDNTIISEDWQLSQFWYDDDTVTALTNAILKIVHGDGKVALVSCPTLYKPLKQKYKGTVNLFEYDKRFSFAGEDFHFYDYNNPLEIAKDLKNEFDIVIVDPPFLSEECLTKTALTIKYLAKDKIVLCTGAVMGELAERLLKLKKCSFEPHHKNNLANEFCCYSNFDLDSFI